MNRSYAFRRAVFALMLAGSASPAQDDPGNDLPTALWSSKHITAHALLQAGTRLRLADDPTGGTYANNITAHTSRLQMLGNLGDGFEFYVQWEFTRTPGLLDTRIGYRINEALAFDLGYFKTPMGREFLTSTENTDLISSASLLSLSPGRDAGVQGRLKLTKQVELRAGVFNGNGSYQNGDNTALLAVSRASFTSVSSGGAIMVGVSGGIDPGTPGGGEYSVLSGDIRIESGPIMAAAEVLYRTSKADALASVSDAYGFYLTGGYAINVSTGAKVRFQRLVAGSGAGAQDDLILNISHAPNRIFGLSVELILPVNDPFPYDIPARILTQVQMYL